ncbi:hypothetical protein QA601_07215 [Chitinispirillales bacterium ANBcel5]|uniref:nickel/cobalt transporter n=1 Tax=Cellulosispirillum alkaliphilum TaxID=3039283 RepID=UPI002A5473B7|nr:hypothetical protein [Chitinispirillales bacterium ANBcel5]
MKYLIILIVMFFFSMSFAQSNPFLPTSPAQERTEDSTEKEVSTTTSVSGNLTSRIPFMNTILRLQHSLNRTISGRLRSIDEGNTLFSVAVIVLLAFVYGVIHSLGPGHAKLLISTHTLTQPDSLLSSWFAGALFALVHTSSAILLFLLVRVFLLDTSATGDNSSQVMMRMSGVMIMVVGAILLLAPVLKKLPLKKIPFPYEKFTSLPALSFSAGIVPCPGAFLILIFSNTLGMLHWGIVSVVSLSVGMAITVSVIGTAGVVVRRKLQIHGKGKMIPKLFSGVRYAGAVIIILLGFVMAI